MWSVLPQVPGVQDAAKRAHLCIRRVPPHKGAVGEVGPCRSRSSYGRYLKQRRSSHRPPGIQYRDQPTSTERTYAGIHRRRCSGDMRTRTCLPKGKAARSVSMEDRIPRGTKRSKTSVVVLRRYYSSYCGPRPPGILYLSIRSCDCSVQRPSIGGKYPNTS